MWGRSSLVLVALALPVAGCGGESAEQRASSAPAPPPAASPLDGRRLERNGISLAVPAGWDGRILYREPTGTVGVTFQVANFELPANEGLAPPPAPADGRDPIKAMAGNDVLVTIATDEQDGAPAHGRIGLGDLTFLAPGAARVPVGHALAEGSVCLGTRCFGVAADFGRAPPDRRFLERVDDILASVTVGEPHAIELDGLRLDVPPGWHGYATRIGPDGSQPLIWAANVRFAESLPPPDFPYETLRRLPSGGVLVEVVAAPSSGPRSSAPFTDGERGPLGLPLTLSDGTFLARDYEGQPATHVSTVMVEGLIGRRTLFVQVYFGRNEPTGAMREAADAVLASISL